MAHGKEVPSVRPFVAFGELSRNYLDKLPRNISALPAASRPPVAGTSRRQDVVDSVLQGLWVKQTNKSVFQTWSTTGFAENFEVRKHSPQDM